MKRPILLPLVPLYAAGLALREMRLEHGWEPVRRLQHPVISIGNLSTGGSGKTPLTITLAKLLAARGLHVDVLSRGYGRRSAVPLRVDPKGSADQFGDEPLLIAREAAAPVYVAAERYDAGRLAEDEFTRQGGELAAGQVPLVHILDDGFQHRQLVRDVDILLLSRDDWQDHLLPAGNLRERHIRGKTNERDRNSGERFWIRSGIARLGLDGGGMAPAAAGWRFRRLWVRSRPSAASPDRISSLLGLKLRG